MPDRNDPNREVLVRMSDFDRPEKRHYATADDAQLVQWAKDDTQAFGELYQRYVRKIYNYVYYRTGNHHDAEDLTSRVFYRALGHIGRYTDRGVPFSAWLYRIAHNLVANWHRDRGRKQIVALDDYLLNSDDGYDAPEHVTQLIEDEEQLLDMVRSLPAERQELLILKFVEHLSNAEIGTVMNRTEGAIKSLYHRTLTTLRDKMGNDRGQDASDS